MKTKKAKYMREKFHKLKQEGFKGKQLIAVALEMTREHEKKKGK